MRSGEACTERSRSVVFGPGGGAVGVAGQGSGAMSATPPCARQVGRGTVVELVG
jgi:hypothetical protein